MYHLHSEIEHGRDMMVFNPVFVLRLCGLAGILGALLFIAGDLLYQHIPGSKASLAHKMAVLSPARLCWAALLGLPGSWLYVLGSAQLYFAFQPAGAFLAGITSVAFAAVMIAYGLAHVAYYAIASGVLVAVQNGLDAEQGAAPGSRLYSRLVNVIYVPVIIASALMLYLVGTGQSLYPRWMLVFLPIFLYLLKNPVVKLLPGRLSELARDSYDNQVLLIFFLLSTIVLWRGGR
jgi:hypothetical protein